MIGGAGSIAGPVVGAVIVGLLPELAGEPRGVSPAVLRRPAAGGAVGGAGWSRGRAAARARVAPGPRCAQRRSGRPGAVASDAGAGRVRQQHVARAPSGRPVDDVRRRPRGERTHVRGAAGGGDRADRPQRRGQDHRAQHAERVLPPDGGRHCARQRRAAGALPRFAWRAAASRAPTRPRSSSARSAYSTTSRSRWGAASWADSSPQVASGPQRRESAARSCSRSAAIAARSTHGRATCPTSIGGWSRSRARWPRGRRCCCSTSPRPDSRRTTRRAWRGCCAALPTPASASCWSSTTWGS